ncbi:hypothetical protein EYF80_006211 [Liparis tanakae]|uniref:Uncharacterized protein n=1 Tax=Liparis tanakae TaxID=230148 RepID=A0A4Z2J2I6_9TELE|nr:hypothetical protein EYF80_006211 [Liparis tanakae]
MESREGALRSSSSESDRQMGSGGDEERGWRESSMRLISGAGSPSGSGGGGNSPLEDPMPRPWPLPPAAPARPGTPTPRIPFSLAAAMACCWSVSNTLKSRSPRRSCSSFSLADPSSDITAGSEVRSASDKSLVAVLPCGWVELEANRWLVELVECSLLSTTPATPG